MSVLLLASPDIAQFRMRGSLQSESLSRMNRDWPIKPEGEVIEWEGAPGELTRVPYFAVGKPEAQRGDGVHPEPHDWPCRTGLDPGPQFWPWQALPCHRNDRALTWRRGPTLISL